MIFIVILFKLYEIYLYTKIIGKTTKFGVNACDGFVYS
jgi:hypothetical protein